MTKQTEALKLAIKAMKSFQEGTGGLYEGEFDEEIKTCEEALAQLEQKRPQNCGTSICSCIECVMEPDYKALWEQMCERCDELDKKLAQLEHLEPVAWMSKDADIVYASIQVDGCFNNDHIPLYTTPPQRKPIDLNIIRKWPEGFDPRLQHVWLDVVSFIPNVKLYDLQRVLAEYGFEMQIYEAAHDIKE